MTFEKILNDLSSGVLTPENAKALISERDKSRKINYYAHIWEIKKDPLSDPELQELESIVNILQILYNSDAGSPISDSMFDDLQEILINMVAFTLLLLRKVLSQLLQLNTVWVCKSLLQEYLEIKVIILLV